MNLSLVNVNGDTIDLDWHYKYQISSWAPRAKAMDRFGKNGGFVMGDGKSGARKITLKYDDAFENVQEFRDWANNFIRFFLKENEPFHLVDTDGAGRRTKVALEELPPEWDQGVEEKIITSPIKLIMEDACWEDLTATPVTWNAVSNGDTNSIVVNGSYSECDPIITVTALDNLPEFSILNNTLGAGIKVAHPGFIAGKTMIIDCEEGTISVDGIYIPGSITEGGFIFLLPQTNVLEYESAYGQANILIEYRKVYGY